MAQLVDSPNNELNEFDLPRTCIATGATDGVVFKPVKFAWYPKWPLIFVPITLAIAIILAV
ncbi:MAG: hypothetical protein IRZ16_13135 [Myxococcaceae bacterium]|nr:hypothetical protein [Myxococcaceae bacterium]